MGLNSKIQKLLEKDILFPNSVFHDNEYKLVLYVDCSDVFCWGCADAESISTKELSSLYSFFIESQEWGSIKWCCVKRNMQPQKPIKNMMIEVGSWCEMMENLPLNPDQFR